MKYLIRNLVRSWFQKLVFQSKIMIRSTVVRHLPASSLYHSRLPKIDTNNKPLIINPAKRENTRKCGQAIANTWFNNITFPADFTINQAIQSARKNEDAGSTGARQMIPKDFRYHAWMDYVQLITVYYNFGKETKKITILRKGWWGTCITIWVSYM